MGGIQLQISPTSYRDLISYSWYYDIRRNEWQVLQKIFSLKNAKKTCATNIRNLNRD